MIALLTTLLVVGANPHLPVARSQLSNLEEKAALKTLDKAIAWPDTTPEELAQIWLCIGLAHAGLIHEKEARAAFRTALVIDPNLALPQGLNPTWLEWWREAKVERPPVPEVKVAAPIEVTAPPAPAPAPLPPGRPAWRTGLGLGLAVAAVVAIAAGGLVGVQARALSQKAATEPRIGPAQSLQRDAEARATTANVLYGTGGGLLAGGGLVFFWP
ncbi:MAG: hypothetical protein H6Q89_889 [Myxococcaceae bacterium]|nr:hypothetical protein [Myxococcaceae bacterium]